MLSCQCFLSKLPFSQKHDATYHFFQTLHERPPAVIAHISSKTSILPKILYFMGQKGRYDGLFQIFHNKITALMPIFYQKYVYFLK